jgi:hypothetical protein
MTFLDEDDDTASISSQHRFATTIYTSLNKIAECNEVIVGKIARQDYPMNWYLLMLSRLSL